MTVEAGHLYEVEEEDNHDVLLIIGVHESRVLVMHLYDSLACTYFHVSVIKKLTRIPDVHEWFQRKRDVAVIKAREMVRTHGTNAAQTWAVKAGVWEALDRLAAALRSEDITQPEVTTLEGAIEHAEGVAASCDVTRPACAADHRRLAGWLRELQARRAADATKEPRTT